MYGHMFCQPGHPQHHLATPRHRAGQGPHHDGGQGCDEGVDITEDMTVTQRTVQAGVAHARLHNTAQADQQQTGIEGDTWQ